jgi:outer membrane lipoprotein-sorting protein
MKLSIGMDAIVGDFIEAAALAGASIKEGDGEDAPFRASVWIDPDNMLPLKRTITWKFGAFQVASISETYKNIAVDKKIDPDKFQLTKN